MNNSSLRIPAWWSSYLRLASFLLALFLMANLHANGAKMDNRQSVIPHAFHDAQELNNWRVVNDTVMGGVSSSAVATSDVGLRFFGNLSLDNNGGFASVRRFGDAVRLSDSEPLKLTVVGDGRSYQLRLRTGWEFNSVSYAVTFDTQAGQETTVTFTPQDFVPVWRGQRVMGAPELKFSDVLQPGFMLADKQPGKFMLEIKTLYQ